MDRIFLKPILLFISLCLCLHIYSQPPGNWGNRAGTGPQVTGKIIGQLVDSLNSEVLPFASVSLVEIQSGKTINGGLTDENGRFKLLEVKVGTYELRTSFLGYKDVIINPITTSKQKPDIDLGQILMTEQALQLDEVEISAEKSMIENKIDRIVYNAELDVNNVGGDAADVLRKVPLLMVDLDGNVSLRGSNNIQILINGKPSGMFSSSVADALKMIPAEEIKSVEVITVPGAKYDAEGSGGIINIITKKRKVEGLSGSASASVGNRANNSNLSIAYAKGRFGINGNGSFRNSWPRGGESYFFRADTLDGAIRELEQVGESFSGWNGFGGRFGAFYDFNAYNSLISSFNYRGNFSNRDVDNQSVFIDPLALLDQQYSQVQETFGLFSGYDWNTEYIKTYEQKDREFSIGVQVSGNINNQNYTLLRESDLSPELYLNEESVNDGDNLELTFQTDYTHPFGERLKLETGAKAILRQISSDYYYQVALAAGSPLVRDESRSNVFGYGQDVYAGYAQINWVINEKYSLLAGGRYEHTSISGQFESGGNPFENQYDNFLPSLIFSRKLKGFSNIKISYTQRLQRPSLFYINPFVNSADPRNITLGNPLLDPEVSNQVELAYSKIFNGIVLNMAVFYRLTNDVIEPILTVSEDGITQTSFQNISQNQSFGFDFFGSATLWKIFTIRPGFGLNSYDATGIINGEEVSRTGWIYSIKGSGSIKLPKDFQIEMFGFYRSPNQSLQGIRTSFYIYNIGIRKQIFDKKGSLGVNVIQPFQRNLSFDSEFSGTGFYQLTQNQIPFRSFNLNASYRFGTAKNQRQRKSKLGNDDQKQGEQSNF